MGSRAVAWVLVSVLVGGPLGCTSPSSVPAPAPPPAPVDPAPEPDPEIVEVAPPAPPPEAALVVDTGDLDAIVARGALRILAFGSGELLLPRVGGSTLSDRELAVALAGSLGVDAEIIAVARYEDLIPMLLEGKGDVVAARFAETQDRKRQVAFSRPTAVVEEVLVARVGAPGAPRRIEDLAGKTVTVRKSSSYRETLDALVAAGSKVLIVDAEESLDTASLVERVAAGQVELTVVDSDLLAHIQAYSGPVEALFPLRRGRQIGLGLRPTTPKLKAAADAFLIQAAMTSHARKLRTDDLAAMKERGSLRMLTRNDALSYHLHKGQQRGFDYELTRLFAESQGLRLDVVVVEEERELVEGLLSGRGDLIAAQLVPTEALAARIALSAPYLRADDELVVRAGLGGPFVWGARTDNPTLQEALARFFKKTDRGLAYNLLRARYLGGAGSGARAAASASAEGAALSPFDPIFRARATQYGLDWRLVASQAFQESGFDPKARSHVGALGLLQVMPATGLEMGFRRLHDPDEGTHAGVRYLARLIDQFERELPFKQRVRFALASYNVGKGHVDDARALAARMGWNPNKWFHHVEKAMLLLQDRRHARRARHGWCRGEEPVKYVSEIQSRYENYLHVVKDL